MKKTTLIVTALAMVLGLAQCKKEQTPTNDAPQGTPITLTVVGSENNDSKVDVDPAGNPNYATLAFETGDVIYVGYNNQYVGQLTYTNGAFSGNVNIDEQEGDQPLHFYFLGGTGFNTTFDANNTTASVVISNQTSKYPVISYNPSNENYTGAGAYTAKLMNKCSIMKFVKDSPLTTSLPVCITGMNNKVTVDFSQSAAASNGFTYTQDGDGLITMPAPAPESGETWAIVLPQPALSEEGKVGTAYFVGDDTYTGIRPAIQAIEPNKYYNKGIEVEIKLTEVEWTPDEILAVLEDHNEDYLGYEVLSFEAKGISLETFPHPGVDYEGTSPFSIFEYMDATMEDGAANVTRPFWFINPTISSSESGQNIGAVAFSSVQYKIRKIEIISNDFIDYDGNNGYPTTTLTFVELNKVKSYGEGWRWAPGDDRIVWEGSSSVNVVPDLGATGGFGEEEFEDYSSYQLSVLAVDLSKLVFYVEVSE